MWMRLTDLADMFEGALRTVQEMPGGWWSSWFLLALGLGLLHRAQPAHRRWMRWAWTDHRLLVLELADRHRVQITWVVSCALAGLALSLSMVGMGAVADSAIPSWPLVWKGVFAWALLLFLRWVTALLWDLRLGDHHVGDVFFLNHRLHMESAAWLIAPVGFVCSTWGPDASRFGFRVALFLWVAGWFLRQRRGVSQNPLFRKQPLLGMLYLCSLEILPVAVLFRIWQG